jgi:hypothetical protein
VKINTELLPEIIRVHNSYSNILPVSKEIISQKAIKLSFNKPTKLFTISEQLAIQNRYLKGVSISDLTMQFDCSAKLIEQILTSHGIAMVDNKVPKIKRYRKPRNQ